MSASGTMGFDESRDEAPDTPTKQRTEAILERFHEEATFDKGHDVRLLLSLWPFIKSHQLWFWVATLVIMVTAVASLLTPLIMRDAIDHGVLQKNPGQLMRGGLLFAGVVLLEQLLSFIQIYALQIVGARAMADLRLKVFTFLHQLRIGFFDAQPVGRLVTRVTNDVDAVLELFASGALSAFGDLIRLVGIVILMLVLDYQLSLIAFAAIPPVGLIVWRVRRRARSAFRLIRAKTARMNATMNEQVNGMTVIQAYNRQHAAEAEFDDINVAYRDANISAIKYDAIQDAAIDAVQSIALALIIVALGYHDASFGTVVAFSAYLTKFFEPLSAIAQRYTLLQSALAGAERVFRLLELEAPDAPKSASAPDGDPELAIELSGVGFSYKAGVPVLDNVSFSARRGEKIALVGPTGSGKSTITSLCLRLYDVDRGVVRVNGRDVRGLDRDALRTKFAVVPQDVYLFRGTLAQNIAAGSTPDLARAEEVLRRIDAYDLLTKKPGGLEARVDEAGANYSAGERQLIAFARALYRDAEILILDEATASVDSDTESRLQKALEEVIRDRTALVIAHRLSTVRASDRIVVLQKGHVVESGSHDQLLEAGGLYHALYELQFARQTEQRLSQPPPA